MLMGVAGFVIFALVLEAMIHRIVIGRFITADDLVLYVIYGALMAGIFEESARFIAFKIYRRMYKDVKDPGIGTALSYGTGHGGIESVLLAGFSMVSMIVNSVIINTGNIETITGKYEGETLAALNSQIAAILNTPPYMFLAGGIERVMAITVQLALSVMVFYAVFGKNKLWLYPLAVVFHAVVDVPAVMFQTGAIKSIFAVEGIICLFTVCVALFAKFLHGKLSATVIADPSPPSV
jgi:uncharacterized membrane protein YhfC